MSLCVGLTGGIASGKSTVVAMFADLGVPWIDADDVARAVVEPGERGLLDVVAVFGDEVLDDHGRLDRRRMRERVFADPGERKRLESLLHPLIRERLRTWREALAAPYGLMVVPILLEGGFDSLVDRVLVIDVPTQIQIERLVDRDQISEELAGQMLAAQMSREQRLAAAHETLDNSLSRESLVARVRSLHEMYLQLAAERTTHEPERQA